MAQGILYIMTTAVSGLIKLGQCQIAQFETRMQRLERDGYHNVTGLRRTFAISVEDARAKEDLLKEVLAKHRVADSELFSLDVELMRQLLLAFDGRVVFPETVNKDKNFEEISTARRQSAMFSFYRKGIPNKAKIVFVDDPDVVATVCGEREVAYDGEVYKLSALAYKLFAQRGKLNRSGAYQGARYFTYNGKRLTSIPDKY